MVWQEDEIEDKADGNYGHASRCAALKLSEWLAGLYWKIKQETYDDGHPDPKMADLLLEVIKLITCHEDSCQEGMAEENFRFFIGAFNPLSKEYEQREGESDFEMSMRGKKVSDKERELIENHFRERIKRFEPSALEKMLLAPWVPFEFQQLLAIARARKGGPELAKKDIRNARLLSSFRPDDRSDHAKRHLRKTAEAIAQADKVLKETLSTLDIEISEYRFELEKGQDRINVIESVVVEHFSAELIKIKLVLDPRVPEQHTHLFCDLIGQPFKGGADTRLYVWAEREGLTFKVIYDQHN